MEIGTPRLRHRPAAKRPSPLVSQIQTLLLQAGLPVGSKDNQPDGLFGPTTAKSWNILMDKAQISSDSAPRANPRNPRPPSPAVMRYVARFGKEILSRARPAAAKPAPKPAPAPAAKSVPESKPVPQAPGHEPTPEEWAKMDAGERRQYELAKKMRESGGGDIRTYRPGR